MLDAMSMLALDYLREQLLDGLGEEADPWTWYLRVREEKPELLFPYLIEKPQEKMSPNYYVLRADKQDPTVAVLEQHEFRRNQDEPRLPWFQLPGNMSGDAGPLIKRSAGGGPTPNVTKQTFERLRSLAVDDLPWSRYLAEATKVLECQNLRFRGEVFNLNLTALDSAISVIPEDKATCFLTFADEQERLPGDRKDYAAYLQAMLPDYKYVTKDGPPVQARPCALCSTVDTVYPSALRGTGLNLSNLDRLGVFSSLDKGGAWKKFALCASCADLLYTFSYHVRELFHARVAGERALLIPYTTLDPDKRLKFMRRVRKNYLPQVATGKPLVEQEHRLRSLADEEGVITNLTILWADFGQKLENVHGVVTDILPSRLRTISKVIGDVNNDESLPFPQERNYGESLKLDVAFNYLAALLRRPGGKRTEKVNKGARLFEFKRDMAAAVYHGRRAPVKRFWEEAREVWEAYLIDALERNHYGLLYEGRTKQGENYLTMAGWIRHLCRFIYFLRQLEVYPRMEDRRYRPRTERLRSIFSEFFEDADGRTGIDGPEKAYAFLLGALFGKLMQVQGARGVNVGANALPWLKRLTLTGKDLPELYGKIRVKLLTYETRSSDITDVIEELGYLGATLGTRIDLNQTETGYFLLLGQSLSHTFMPSKARADGEETA